MPGSSTHGWRSTHHTCTVGFTPDLSSSAPALTATTPAVFANSETIGEPHERQNLRRTYTSGQVVLSRRQALVRVT